MNKDKIKKRTFFKKCSNCGFKAMVTHPVFNSYIGTIDFCLNCGFEIRKEQVDDEVLIDYRESYKEEIKGLKFKLEVV